LISVILTPQHPGQPIDGHSLDESHGRADTDDSPGANGEPSSSLMRDCSSELETNSAAENSEGISEDDSDSRELTEADGLLLLDGAIDSLELLNLGVGPIVLDKLEELAWGNSSELNSDSSELIADDELGIGHTNIPELSQRSTP